MLLATGGFEWDPEVLERHVPRAKDRLGSPRTNTGDGQKMVRAAGAELARMDQANIHPTLPTLYEGRPHGLYEIRMIASQCGFRLRSSAAQAC